MADAVVEYLGHGAYRLVEPTRARVAYATAGADGVWVFLNGRVYIVEGAPGSALIHPGGTPQEGVAQPVTPRPVRGALGPFKGRAKSGMRGHDDDALTAPMPATVVAIAVEEGQRVSRGDVLVMLEAMKMELPIKAPRDGVVRAIACRPGELVQPGVPLLEIE